MMRWLLIVWCLAWLGVTGQTQVVPEVCGDMRGFEADCGRVYVPLDVDGDDEIMLVFVRFRNTNAPADAIPLIYLHGGPGGQVVTFGAGFAQALRPLWRGRDLVLYDQRGIGQSAPRLDCQGYNDLVYRLLEEGYHTYDDAMWVEVFGTVIGACGETYQEQGIDLGHYTTEHSARDVVAMMDALGYEQAHLLGVSYGSRLALSVVAQYPERVASLILDSVVAPHIDTESEFGLNFYQALMGLSRACVENVRCGVDFAGDFLAIVEAHNAEPVVYRAYDSRRNMWLDVVVSGDLLLESLFNLLYERQHYDTLPAQIERLGRGEYDYFVGMLLRFLGDIEANISIGMYYGVMCQDAIGRSDGALARALNEGTAPVIADFAGDGTIQRAVCERLGLEAGEGTGAIIRSDVPTLVLSGEFDPITPPSWGEAVVEHLPNGVHYVIAGNGHGAVFTSRCALGLATQFIERGVFGDAC